MSQTTYRFKFNQEVLESIEGFSKKHANDNCHDFASAFDLWKIANKDLISKESDRMVNLGFKGNIELKMYKSARYYFKNKAMKKTQLKKNTKNKSTSKKNYISRNPEFFSFIECYILEHRLKASTLYDKFINEIDSDIVSIIQREITRLKSFDLTEEEAKKKIHKTFNNAYYKIKKNLEKNPQKYTQNN